MAGPLVFVYATVQHQGTVFFPLGAASFGAVYVL